MTDLMMEDVTMKLWLISRVDRVGYDEYDALVAIAETEEAARNTHPYNDRYKWNGREWAEEADTRWTDRDWPDPITLTVLEIGTALPGAAPGIVLASFNAG
jgi:hypothetical protein